MILVTTRGKVGAETARLLAASGSPVRIVSRRDEPALASAGVEIALGDLDDRDSVNAAMYGVTSVVLVSPAVSEQERRVIESADQAGVEHVVKITSKASADSPIARRRQQAEIEDALFASGMNWTLLRNNAYMQNFLMLAPTIAARSSFASAGDGGRIGMVDTRDVAAVAAHISANPNGHAGETLWPTGPAALTYRDAATVLSRVLDRPIEFRSITVSEQRQAMIEAGVPEPVALDNALALQLFAEGDADYITDDVLRLLSRPARTFEQFVVDNVAAFNV